MLAVFDHTHSAVAVAALLLAGQALPAFVVPAVVARVEASARRSELSGLYMFEAVTTAVLAILLWHFWLPAVLLLAALDGTAALAASALLRAAVARGQPGITSKQRVRRRNGRASEHAARPNAQEAERKANAALNVGFSITFVLGPVLGGAAVAAAGAPTALFIDVGSFVICGALLIDLHPHVEEAVDSVRARLRTAWRHINEAPSLRGLLLADAVALSSSSRPHRSRSPTRRSTLHSGDGASDCSWAHGEPGPSSGASSSLAHSSGRLGRC